MAKTFTTKAFIKIFAIIGFGLLLILVTLIVTLPAFLCCYRVSMVYTEMVYTEMAYAEEMKLNSKEIEKHQEADPYKIHQEYRSEPWRQSSSYPILFKYCLELSLLNLILLGIIIYRNKHKFYMRKK